MEQGKNTGAATGSRTVNDVQRAGKELAQKVRQAGQGAAARAAKVGKAARGIGADLQKRAQRVQKDLAPAAAKAKKGLAQAQKGLGKAWQATAKATRKSARVLGIKAQIAAAAHKLENLHGQIGEAYLKAQRRKGAVPIADSTVAGLVKSAEAQVRRIQKLRTQEKLERASS
jgi:hypothetical protein